MSEPRTSTPPVPPGMDFFGRWFELTFRAFGATWQVWVLQALIILGIMLAAAGIIFAIIFGTLAAFGLLNAGPNPHMPPTAVLVIVVESLVLGLILIVLGVYLHAGMLNTALMQARGETISPGDIFSAGWAVPGFIGMGFLIGLLLIIGYSLCIIPGIILSGMLYPTFAIYLDRRLGVIGSMAESFHLTGQNIWLFTAFAIVMHLLINAIDSIPFGALVGVPLTVIAPVVVYTSLYYASDIPPTPEAGP